MRNKRIWLSVMFMVIALLVGCGNEQSNNGESNQPQKNTETSSESSEMTEETESTETPIVKKEGNVDEAAYAKAVSLFEGIVKKMREEGLVNANDVCVKMNDVGIEVDITFDNSDVDLKLVKDSEDNVYILIFDYNFIWLEGFGPTINGKDPATHNKELLIAILGMISNEPKALFDRIDLDCFSAAGLSDSEWEKIGDCSIMSDGVVGGEFISYKMRTE